MACRRPRSCVERLISHHAGHLLRVGGRQRRPGFLVAKSRPGLNRSAHGATVLIDYFISVVGLGFALLIMWIRPHDLAARLLAVGMVGIAAVFNQPSHIVFEILPAWINQPGPHFIVHATAGPAFAHALLVFPDGRLRPRWAVWPLAAIYLLAHSDRHEAGGRSGRESRFPSLTGTDYFFEQSLGCGSSMRNPSAGVLEDTTNAAYTTASWSVLLRTRPGLLSSSTNPSPAR